MFRRSLILASTLVAISLASSARAQPAGQDIATAQALFDEGKRLMQEGHYDEGCPKLVESQRLDPAGGTLLVIALCHEGQGKTATAWAEFGVALGEARKDRRSDREQAAQEHIRALEPKLTRARIVVTMKAAGLEVQRDGSRVGDAQWGTALPIDPGAHVFEARAPGKKPWSKTMTIQGEGATVDVAIPALEDEAIAPPIPPPVVQPAPAQAAPAEPQTSRLPWAAVAGGVGILALGVGIGTGLSASSLWDDAKRACPGGRCRTEADRDKGESAGDRADVSTAFFIIAGVGLATAAVLVFTEPRTKRDPRAIRPLPFAGPSSAGVVIGGAL